MNQIREMFLLSEREMLLDYNRGKGEKKPMSKITRRDFINGTLMVAGASMLPIGAISPAVLDTLDPLHYPPPLTGAQHFLTLTCTKWQ
jgi:hypothetical protein